VPETIFDAVNILWGNTAQTRSHDDECILLQEANAKSEGYLRSVELFASGRGLKKAPPAPGLNYAVLS